ncbi:MAG: ATPase [Ruminococcus sp.]|nr:ATPase [Ruminococcus sp.]MDD6709483.1 ATPase [Ruminococcus sp.]
MRVEDLINELEDMMNDAKVLPLTGGKAVVDTEAVLDILDDIQDALPGEVRQAKSIVADRSQILAEAKKEAEEIIRAGEEKKKQLVAEDKITKQAQAQAADILSDAKKKSSEMKKAANGYVTDLMKRADETLTDLTNEIRKTRQDIQAQKKD